MQVVAAVDPILVMSVILGVEETELLAVVAVQALMVLELEELPGQPITDKIV
jgi:hypothetical protein